MNQFKDFGIKPQSKSFEGDKIKIDRILNKKISVHDFKIEQSKYEKGTGKCLYMQIEVDGQKRVLFTGSASLMDMIQQVDKTNFPFETTIIKENERFQFT